MWYIHTIQYYSAMEKIEVLIYAMMRMNLKSFMLSKRNQSEKTTYYEIPLYKMFRISKSMET